MKVTDITFVLDRSGSMVTIKDDMIGGINRFIEDQKKVGGECYVTLVQFDSQNPFEIIYEGQPIDTIPALTSQTFVPRGATPLLDAIVNGINHTGKRLEAIAERDRPNEVLFIIITDGLENASQINRGERGRAKVHSMITHQTTVYKWHFVYLGANQDAIQVGSDLGIGRGQTMTYTSGVGPGGAHARGRMFKNLSRNTTALRSGTSANMNFTDEQRKEAVKPK